ncbi:MAG: DNA polymerase III subunit chi [Pseudomonadota bacterium]
MTEVLFYHLEHGQLETTLPSLLEKSLARDWRVVVKSGTRACVEKLDDFLWTFADESFLPHSAVSSEQDAVNDPIWLTDAEVTGDGRNLLFLVDGATENASTLNTYERCVVIFDGRVDEAVSEARQFWKAASQVGCQTTYWRQSPEGRWEKQA